MVASPLSLVLLQYAIIAVPLMYVIKEHDGKVWYIKLGSSPSKMGFIGVDRVCVILENNIEHSVNILQNGKIGSIVFNNLPS